MISVEKVNKSFDGFQALNNLEIHIKKGSIYGLIGTNGAGKTTTIKHIMGGASAGQRHSHNWR